MDRYVVMGNPVEHSRSPEIHALFARQTGEQMEYATMLVPVGRFAESATEFVAAGGRGFNVTLPFKQEAWRWVEERSEEAERSGAVNTVVVSEDGACRGHNTDGMGLVADLTRNLHWVVAGVRVLVLGAGGAAAGILPALIEQRPAELVVANRTFAKAELLAQQWRGEGEVAASTLAEVSGPFELVVNATSASLQGDRPDLSAEIIDARTCCYDLVYGPGTTPFNRWALHQGAEATCDGLGMLVEQAAFAFELWRGVRPSTGPVIEEIRTGLET